MVAVQPAAQIVKDDIRPDGHGLLGEEADMRNDDRVLRLQQDMIFRKRRFLIENVQAGAGELAALQCVIEILVHDDRASGYVDQDRAVLHFGDGLLVDHAAGLVVDRAVQHDDVGTAEQFVQADLLYVFRSVRVEAAAVGQDFRAEGMIEFSGTAADVAETDDADSLALDLGSHVAAFRGACAAERLGLLDVAEQRERQSDTEFGDGFGGIPAGVADSDALGGCGFDINVVNAGKGDVDVFQIAAGFDDLSFERHVRQDDGVRVTGFLFQDFRIGAAGEIRENMSFLFERSFELCQTFRRDAERFK